MKVTKIVDADGKTTGSVSVRVPRGPEVYDPADGALYSEEILSADDYAEQSKPVDPKAAAREAAQETATTRK